MMHIYGSECEAGPAFPTEVEAYGSEKGQLSVDDITNVLKKLGRKKGEKASTTSHRPFPPSLLRWEK